jgi:thiosulfate/3-mercaptopyruvate sulfurtransferase
MKLIQPRRALGFVRFPAALSFGAALLFSASLLFAGCSVPAPEGEWSAEQEAVWNTVQELWALSTSGDVDAWFAKVSDDYRGWSQADRVPRDKAAWRQSAEERFASPGPERVSYHVEPVSVDIHGNVAIVFYAYDALMQSPDGALSPTEGQWTDVFRRRGREWLLIADAGGETGSTENMLVSTDWLERHLDDPELVDVQVESQVAQYAEGHIPGAWFLHYDRIAWDGETGLGAEFRTHQEIRQSLERMGLRDSHRIVVYSSHPLLSARLWLTLDALGVGQSVSLLDGGLAAWTSEGRALSTTGPAAHPPGALTLRSEATAVVDAEWIQENLENPDVALLDARYPQEYTGEGQETEQVGHLPGAGSAPWDELLESREMPRLLPVEDLRARFLEAGGEPGEAVVSYCIIGLRASLDYFVARLLGHETYLYDGSWRDWTARGLPLVTGASPR